MSFKIGPTMRFLSIVPELPPISAPSINPQYTPGPHSVEAPQNPPF